MQGSHLVFAALVMLRLTLRHPNLHLHSFFLNQVPFTWTNSFLRFTDPHPYGHFTPPLLVPFGYIAFRIMLSSASFQGGFCIMCNTDECLFLNHLLLWLKRLLVVISNIFDVHSKVTAENIFGDISTKTKNCTKLKTWQDWIIFLYSKLFYCMNLNCVCRTENMD